MNPSGWVPTEEGSGPPTTEPVAVVLAFQAAIHQEGDLRQEDIADLVTPGFLAAMPDLDEMREHLAPFRATFQRPKPISGVWVEVDIFAPPPGLEGDWKVWGPHMAEGYGCYLRRTDGAWRIARIGKIGLELQDMPD